jgi:aerobic-type carbon monoxide dehydrogenase small subunit (CoxS/CutS family)
MDFHSHLTVTLNLERRRQHTRTTLFELLLEPIEPTDPKKGSDFDECGACIVQSSISFDQMIASREEHSQRQ